MARGIARGPTCRIMLAALLSIKTDSLPAVVCVYVISFLKTTDKKTKLSLILIFLTYYLQEALLTEHLFNMIFIVVFIEDFESN